MRRIESVKEAKFAVIQSLIESYDQEQVCCILKELIDDQWMAGNHELVLQGFDAVCREYNLGHLIPLTRGLLEEVDQENREFYFGERR